MTEHPWEQVYVRAIDRILEAGQGSDVAYQQAVGGGPFETIGLTERALLLEYGLRPTDYVIDVGCGSGRLAKPLAEVLHGPYLGTDISSALVTYARQLVGRPDWRFEVVSGPTIPEADSRADLVCFFSVFTHLLNEETYRYLQEAARVLKPGGRIVFTYLEFGCPEHWRNFEAALNDTERKNPLIIFLSREAITVWAEHLGLAIKALPPHGKPLLTIPQPGADKTGETTWTTSRMGQSVCVLVKR